MSHLAPLADEVVLDPLVGHPPDFHVFHSFLERCQALLDDDDLRRKMGDAGRERVRREFSPESRLAELSRLYSA